MSLDDRIFELPDSMYNDFYQEKKVKARKTHYCCQCRDIIVAGENYYVHTGNNDGKWWREKSHESCHHFFLDLIKDNNKGYDYPCFGELEDLINEIDSDILKESGYNSRTKIFRAAMFERVYARYQLEKL
jgi:hypothetical protein